MPTKPKKKMEKKKGSILSLRPPVRKLPPGLKGAKIEDIMAKAKELWDPADPELDNFLQLVRHRRRD